MAFRVSSVLGGDAELKAVILDSDADLENIATATGGTTTPAVIRIYAVEIDCSENLNEEVFTRFYNVDDPTVGSDDADIVLSCAAAEVNPFIFHRGITLIGSTGGATDAYMKVATVTDGGGTGGATSPTGTVKVTIWYKVTDGTS